MKKCRPIMRDWVFSPLPISLIGKLEEFEVSAQSGRASFSISATIFLYRGRPLRRLPAVSSLFR